MGNTETKTPIYKNKWVIIIAIIVLVGIIFGRKEENVSIPNSIEIGEVEALADGGAYQFQASVQSFVSPYRFVLGMGYGVQVVGSPAFFSYQGRTF